MRVLVTRPEPEASALCERLRTLGHSVLVDPLLKIEFLASPIRADLPYQAIVATSQNALRGLARNAALQARLTTCPLYAVGPATAALAKSLGFVRVIEGTGTAAGLAELICRRLEPGLGPILSLAGEITAFDLPKSLRAHGLPVETAIVYRATAARTLSPGTLANLDARTIGAVVLLSARTARIYAALLSMHEQLENIRSVPHLCLAEAVAHGLQTLENLIVRTAAYPNIEELLALVGREAKSLP